MAPGDLQSDAVAMLLDQPITTTLTSTDIRDLEDHLLGEVIRPDDTDYDTARSVWDASVDRHPLLVVRPRTLPTSSAS